MAVRTKPTKAMLKATKPAKAKDYAKMVVAASEVVMRNRNGTLSNQGRGENTDYVLIRFPYFVKFQEGFPKGQLVSKDGRADIRKINAVKLLDWLHANGYSSYSAKQLVQQTKNFERIECAIDRMFDQF